MLLSRYQASHINIGILLSLLALPIGSQLCSAEEPDSKFAGSVVESALSGSTTRVDKVLSYAVVESLSLPPLPTTPEIIKLPAVAEEIVANSKETEQSTLNWKPPTLDKQNTTSKQSAADSASTNVETNSPALKVASRPNAPTEPRELEVGPSLSIGKTNDIQKPNSLKPIEAEARQIPETDYAKEEPIEPILVQPKLTAADPESIVDLEQIDESDSVEILIDKEIAEEEELVAENDKPKHEARISPKSGVTVLKEPLKPLNRSMMNLRSRMRTVLSYYYNKPLNNFENDPWEVMHSMLSYELHSRVLEGGGRGKPITAIGHLCFNRPTGRKQMMYLNENGDLDVRVGVGLQGHKGQFLAMLAQCNVSPDYPIRVEGKEFTIRDLVESEQRSCYSKTELTFKLIGLGHYLASDASWLNDQGEVWDIPRLIKEERTQKIRGAACGGTHRLAGLSLAYRRREARGEPLDGEYREAAKFVSEYQSYAFKLQNSDGSLSTEWFRGRGDEEDIERRIRTTGHLLEWLAYSLPDEQLTARPTVRAVSYLTSLMATYSKQDWHKGSIAHALHALVIYDKRVFQPHDEAEQTNLAVNPTANRYRGYSIYRGVLRGQEAPEASGGFFGLFGNSRSTQRPSSGRTR